MRIIDLKNLLSLHKVKGRSKAKTRDELIALCNQHNLTYTHELPNDVLDIIASCLINTMIEDTDYYFTIAKFNQYFQTIKALEQSSKFFYKLIQTKWIDLLELYTHYEHLHGRDSKEALKMVQSGRISAKRCLNLVVETGCEFCNAKRIRKVYWPFKVRLCESCLYSNTINSVTVISDYGLAKHHFIDRPHNTRNMYTPHTGSYTSYFYWKSDVLKRYNFICNTRYSTFEEINVAKEARIKQFTESLTRKEYAKHSDLFETITNRPLVNMPSVQNFEENYKEKVENQITTWQRKEDIIILVKELVRSQDHENRDEDEFNKIVSKCLDVFTYKYSRSYRNEWTMEWFDKNYKNMIINIIDVHKDQRKKRQEIENRICQSKTAPIHNSGAQNLKCPVCQGSRTFSERGLFDHNRSKHFQSFPI
jgi:hypothetical protein